VKSIDVKTTQNVTITYDLANLLSRFLAWFIDIIVIGVVYVILFSFLSFIVSDEQIIGILIYLIFMPIFFFYSLAWEWFSNGYSLGKYLLKIKVLKLNGAPLNFTDCLLRWSFRMIDIYFSLGAIAASLINSTDHGQRLGDIVANTTVVKLGSKMNISLDDILKIKTIDNYSPIYPGVKRLNEDEMLLIKRVIERSNKYSNKAHAQALQLASQKMARFLELKDVPDDARQFLSTCIRDYIVLTR